MAHSRPSSATREKNDFGRPELAKHLPDPCPTVPDHGYKELLWESGQIVLQSISNKTNKASIPTPFASTSAKAQVEVSHTASTLKAGTYREMGSVGNGLQTTVSPEQTRMNNQEDVMDPRLDYPIDDFYLEFLPEGSGIDLNSLSPGVPADRITGYGHMERDTHALGNASTSRAPAGYSELQQRRQTFMSSSRPRDSNLTMGAYDPRPNGDLPNKEQTQDPMSTKRMQPSSCAPLMNFAHFSRLAARAKSNLQFVDGIRSSETASAPARSNPMGSKLIDSANDLRSIRAFHGQTTSVTSKENLQLPAKPAKRAVSFQNSEPICQEDDARNTSKHSDINTKINFQLPDNMSCHGSSFAGHALAGKNGLEKPAKPVTVSPSICSANGAGTSPNDVQNRAKCKIQEDEASEYQTEVSTKDLEDDSAGTRKPVTRKAMSTKRSRGAGVHNLSERRRRDRINDKIRTLRRLIPNCTKVDKASTLNEAIEYLKTLQMQVQIMSMYGGLHMMPMMLPRGTLPIHPSCASPFAPVGVNMGTGRGLGFGMGMLDMTGSSMITIPHMHGPLYPCGSIPGTGLHGMPGSTNLQMFGIPRQASPTSMPHPTSLTPSTGVSMKVNHAPEVPVMEVTLEQAMDLAPPSSKNQQLQTLEPLGETTTNRPEVATYRQANKECSENPSLGHIGNQPQNIDHNKAANKETERG